MCLTTLPTVCLLLPLLSGFDAPDPYEVGIEVNRISERVLVLQEDTPMENNIVAIATERGIVVVDSAGSFITAKAMRERIAEEFGRDDFAYLINTHYHWDHSRGNQVFADCTIVGHEGVPDAMQRDAERIAPRLERIAASLTEREAQLEALDPDSEEARLLAWRLAFDRRNFIAEGDEFRLTPPAITFRDRLTLNLGDVTMKLIFFGRAHSGTDILIVIPEEGLLLTGDLFLDEGWLPLFAGRRELDVPRSIEVLHDVLDRDETVHTVLPSHRDPWSRAKLVLWQEYIERVWEGVEAAHAAEEELAALHGRFTLDDRYDYLLDLGHEAEELRAFEERVLTAFWRQLEETGAEELEELLRTAGIEAALTRFDEMRAAGLGASKLREDELNALGYEFLYATELEWAVAIFSMNAEAFPHSWNVHDSLGEALVKAGERELAIESYRRSLELNPGNDNGREILRELEAEEGAGGV